MPSAEQIADALIAEMKTTESRAPQSWAALRKRFARVVKAQLTGEASRPAGSDGAPEPSGRLFTTHEVAHLLQVDASTVAKWVDQGKLTAFRTPGGHRRVRDSDFREFCERFKIPVTGSLSAD